MPLSHEDVSLQHVTLSHDNDRLLKKNKKIKKSANRAANAWASGSIIRLELAIKFESTRN